MKTLIVFAFVFLAANALNIHEEWTNFKVKYVKSYKNLVEEEHRFNIFQENLKKIEAHNAKYDAGLKSYYMAVNKFADLTPNEFGERLRLQNGKKPVISGTRHNVSGVAIDSIDWRERRAVMKVKDQGQCGSGWAFSATGSMEGQNAIINKIYVSLSEQELLDCSGSYGNGNCNEGGDSVLAFEYVIDNGLSSGSHYRYTAKQGNCVRNNFYSYINVESYILVDAIELALKDAVATVGPITVGIYAVPIESYGGGIFEDEACDNVPYIDHGVLLVGYGIENGKKYWIIKNSWGTDWGEEGYIRVARDANQCGLAFGGSYPILARI